MRFENSPIPGLVRIWPDVHRDARGSFTEFFQCRRYHDIGINADFVQDMRSLSSKGVLRGLHYQVDQPQGHLVTVTEGQIFDVGVDLRRGSPTFGRCFSTVLDGTACAQMYLPPGVAHGFCVLTERAEIIYKCTAFYAPGDEGGVHWRDPDLAIAWPIENVLISERDSHWPLLRDIPSSRFPQIEFCTSN